MMSLRITLLQDSTIGISMLKKDNLWLGLVLGFALPAALYGLMAWLTTFSPEASFNHNTLMVVSITGNVVLFRYYMMKLEYEQTGKGMLFATMIYAFIFFFFFLNV